MSSLSSVIQGQEFLEGKVTPTSVRYLFSFTGGRYNLTLFTQYSHSRVPLICPLLTYRWSPIHEDLPEARGLRWHTSLIGSRVTLLFD